MDKFPKALHGQLTQRKAENALQSAGSATAIYDFASNDYLGFAHNRQIFDAAHQYLIDHKIVVNGATGSRVVSGNHKLYETAEAYVAKYYDAESALVFNSGYDANVGFFSSVPQKGDIVLYDEFIHPSIRDGIRLSSAASYKYSHNDHEALLRLVERHRYKAGELYIVTESVFSMDGDTPNLLEYATLAEKYHCRLVVDEAHAVGVFGDKGEGLLFAYGLHQRAFARIITFGKAFGCHGAAVLGCAELKTYLSNYARSFIYTTALPPHSLACILSAHRYLEQHTDELVSLHNAIMAFKSETERCRLPFILSFSGIHSIVVPGNERARKMAIMLQHRGFDVKAIQSPAVPVGQERLRFCVHSFNDRRHMAAMLNELTNAIRFS